MLDEQDLLNKEEKKSKVKEKESKLLNIRNRMNSLLQPWGKAM